MRNRHSLTYLIYIGALLVASVLPSNRIQAQDIRPENQKQFNLREHLYFGGGFGLQFGSVTLIEISPLVGYKITPKLSAGLSPSYKYYGYKDYYGYKVNSNVFGGSVFARYYIIPSIFAHSEFETLYFNTKVTGYEKSLQQINSFFVGGGYNQVIGNNSGMYLMVLWNLNDTQDSPYSNPVIRLGFSFGL